MRHMFRSTAFVFAFAVIAVSQGFAQPALLNGTSFTFTAPSGLQPQADFTSASGTLGDVVGWGGYAYGNLANTGGSLNFGALTGSPVLFTFNPRKNDGIGLTAGAPTFDPLVPSSFTVFQPRALAGPPGINTVATINLTLNGSTISNTNANLNSVLTFDQASFWNWAPDANVPLAQRGTFSFSFGPDILGGVNRSISLNYTPVPEPTTILGLSALGFGLVGWRRMRRA